MAFSLPLPTANALQSKKLLNKAVFGHKQTASLKDRIFAAWFNRLVYTQIWEDPVVDMQALSLGPDDHVVAIASGGCNALSYLCAEPAKITAVDLNHAHVALVRLKLAAIASIDEHSVFFQMFGVAKSSSNVQVYKNLIAPKLDADSRAYWEGGAMGFSRIRMFAKDFYKFGLLGQLIGVLHWYARLRGVRLNQLLDQATVQDQERWFDQHVAPIFDSRLVKKLCASPLALYNLGIPPSQHTALCNQSPENMAQVLKERARRLATIAPIADNYFAWQAYARRYDSTGASALPPYLVANNYPTLREAASRMTVEQANLREALSKMEPQSVDAVVLLDAQDWMSAQEITALWTDITRTAKPGARVIFRTAGKDSPIDASLVGELQGKWLRDNEVSDYLITQDRSGIYGGFHLYLYQG